MTTDLGESEDDRALAAFAEVVRDGVDERSAEEIEGGLRALSARIAGGRPKGRGTVRWSLIGAAAIVCLGASLQLVSDAWNRRSTSAPLAPLYQIEGGTVLEGGYLRESSHAGIRLLFSEGSKFVLQPGTRGRLRSVDKDGARVAIEQGTASFQVTPGVDRHWFVEVGPFVVAVKGTVFTVSWDSSKERFELRLRHGHVVVSGPVSGGDVVLRAGQRLVVSLPNSETVISEDTSDEAVGDTVASSSANPVSSPALTPTAAKERSVGPRSPEASASSVAGKRMTEPRWASALASGHWDRILDDVERTGVESALNEASSEDLYALAHAARYRRRGDLARAALLAERRRFPSSPRALDAAFMLGRVEEAQQRGTMQAIAWYDEYLARAPAGPFAAEALGRKMTLTSQSGSLEQARAIAEEYLRRFPRGSYVGSARALRGVR
jgi:TolA-binding protein